MQLLQLDLGRAVFHSGRLGEAAFPSPSYGVTIWPKQISRARHQAGIFSGIRPPTQGQLLRRIPLAGSSPARPFRYQQLQPARLPQAAPPAAHHSGHGRLRSARPRPSQLPHGSVLGGRFHPRALGGSSSRHRPQAGSFLQAVQSGRQLLRSRPRAGKNSSGTSPIARLPSTRPQQAVFLTGLIVLGRQLLSARQLRQQLPPGLVPRWQASSSGTPSSGNRSSYTAQSSGRQLLRTSRQALSGSVSAGHSSGAFSGRQLLRARPSGRPSSLRLSSRQAVLRHVLRRAVLPARPGCCQALQARPRRQLLPARPRQPVSSAQVLGRDCSPLVLQQAVPPARSRRTASRLSVSGRQLLRHVLGRLSSWSASMGILPSTVSSSDAFLGRAAGLRPTFPRHGGASSPSARPRQANLLRHVSGHGTPPARMGTTWTYPVSPSARPSSSSARRRKASSSGTSSQPAPPARPPGSSRSGTSSAAARHVVGRQLRLVSAAVLRHVLAGSSSSSK
ncbi:hypothetical protein C7M84_020288 [Penaeus vannamei]|uniref:Uncharacterized protein n=1 Tax=Penaeus vannamei TaxID=6689 RepID=A0A3R7NM91_PENVA|nr:hypothetical protein C7M84_020288 [Penaeus vannamei]